MIDYILNRPNFFRARSAEQFLGIFSEIRAKIRVFRNFSSMISKTKKGPLKNLMTYFFGLHMENEKSGQYAGIRGGKNFPG